MLGLGLGMAGGARGWLRVARADFWDALATWVGVGSSSPQVPGNPNPTCDSGVNQRDHRREISTNLLLVCYVVLQDLSVPSVPVDWSCFLHSVNSDW